MLDRQKLRMAGWAVVGVCVVVTASLVWVVTDPTGKTASDGPHTPVTFSRQRLGSAGWLNPEDESVNVKTMSCKGANAGGYTMECCAEAEANSVSLRVLPVSANVSSSSPQAAHGLPVRFADVEQPVPRADGKGSMLRVLVTGGAGYIGSHCALRLLEDGHAVTIVDNLSRGNVGAIHALQKVAAPNQVRRHLMRMAIVAFDSMLVVFVLPCLSWHTSRQVKGTLCV